MPYNINFSTGNVTVQPNQIDNSKNVTLIGRYITNYGQYVGNAPIVGTTIELVVGAAGIGRDTTYTSINGGGSGGNGSGGAVFLTWT